MDGVGHSFDKQVRLHYRVSGRGHSIRRDSGLEVYLHSPFGHAGDSNNSSTLPLMAFLWSKLETRGG